MDPDKVKIPGLGFDPTPSTGSSIFSLISSVNKGILNQPTKGILKSKSKYSSNDSAEFYSSTEPQLQHQQNEDNPDFPAPVQKALAVADRLSQVTQFSVMQQRKHGAFLAAKSAVEQIQLGLWKPQEKEEEKIQQAAVEAERKSLPPSRFNRPGQTSERPGLGYKPASQSSTDFYTPPHVQRPKTQTKSSTAPAGSQEFKQPLPVNKSKQAKSLVDYDEDDFDDKHTRDSLDISRKKALEEIDKYRSIPVDKMVSNQSDRNDRPRYKEDSPERYDETARYRKDSCTSDSRSYRYDDSYDNKDTDRYDKRSKDDNYRYDNYDDYDDDDDRHKRHRNKSDRYDRSYDRYERDNKSCDKNREDYDRSRMYDRKDTKYFDGDSDFSEHRGSSHRSRSAESRSSSQSSSSSYQRFEEDNRAYDTHRDQYGDVASKALSASFSKASDTYVGDYEAYKKDIQLRTMKNANTSSADLESKTISPAEVKDAEKITDSSNFPVSNVFDYGHSRTYQSIEEKSQFGRSYGRDKYSNSERYDNQSDQSMFYDEPYRSTVEKESFADQYGNTMKENESQRNTYGNLGMANAAKHSDYNKGYTENAKQIRDTDQRFAQYDGGSGGMYDTRYHSRYYESEQFRSRDNSYGSQSTNTDCIDADKSEKAAGRKGDQLYEDFLFGNDNDEEIIEQDIDNRREYSYEHEDDNWDNGRRFSEQRSSSSSSHSRTGGELQWNYGTQIGSYGDRDKLITEDNKISNPGPRAVSPPGYKCKDCNVSYTIKLHYDAHLQSDSHLLTLQKKAQELFKMTESKPARQSRFDKDMTGQPLTGMVSNIPGPVIPVMTPGGVAPMIGQPALPASIGAEGRRGAGFNQERDVQVIPPKPMGPLKAESIHSTWIRVSWGKLTRIEENMIDQYVVEYRNARETHWVTVGQTENHSYTVNGLQENTDYLIRVYAMNRAEKSDILESVLLTTKRARRDSPGRRSERGRTSRFSDDRNWDRERQEREKQRQQSEKGNNQKEKKADDRKEAFSDDKKKKEDSEAQKKAKEKDWKEVKKGFNMAERLIMAESKAEENNHPVKEKKEEKGEGKGEKEKQEETEKMEIDSEEIPKVEEEKVECQLYKDLNIIKNSPALGLDYIVEVVSYKPVPPHYICKLCNNKGAGPVILKHVAGSPHKMEFFKKEYPEIHDKLLLIAMKKERIQMMDYEGRLIEDRVGRGAVSIHRMCNPADHNGKLVFKEPVSVPAPPPKRKKENKTQPSYTVVKGQFQALYDEAVEHGILQDTALIGLKYIIEYIHPDDQTAQSKFRCTLCSCVCSAGTIFYHITGKKHRMSYFKEKYPDFVEEVTSSKDKSLIHKKAAFIEAQEGHSIVKVAVPKNGTMWRYDKKEDTGKESVEVNITIDGQSGNQTKKMENQSGKQPIKFGLKKTESQPVTMSSGNVLEQAKKKEKEEFDWNKENAELQAKIQNQSVIKCSRPSKFITVYSGFFQRYPVIGMQWVTEFQKPDPKLEPWYMCFMCQQKITWKSIIDHVTSNKHRINYLKKNYKIKYEFLVSDPNMDKAKMRMLVEQFSRQVVKTEGTMTTMEVMLELNINTEALKSVMKIKDVKATSTVTSSTTGQPTTTTVESSSSTSAAAAPTTIEVAPAGSTVISSTAQLPVSSQSVASSALQAASMSSALSQQSLQAPSQAPAVVGPMPGFTGSSTSMGDLQRPTFPVTSPAGLQRPAPVPLMSLSIPAPVHSLAPVQQHFGPQPLQNTGGNMTSINYTQPSLSIISSALSQPFGSQPQVVQAPGTGPMSGPSTSFQGSRPPPWQKPNNQSQVRYGPPQHRMHPPQIGPQLPHSHPAFSQPLAGPPQMAMTAVSSQLVSQHNAPRFGTSNQGPPLLQSQQQPLSSASIGQSSLENPIAQVIQKQAEVVLTKQILTTGTFPPPGTNVFEAETIQGLESLQNYGQGNERNASQGQHYDSNKRKNDGSSQYTKDVKRSRWNEDVVDQGFRSKEDRPRSFGNKRSDSPVTLRQAKYENSKRSTGSVGSYGSKRSRSPSYWKSRDSRSSRQRSFSPASERSRVNEPDRIVRLGKKQDRIVKADDSQEGASSERFGSDRSDSYDDNDVDLYYDEDFDDISQGEFDRPLSPTQLESLVQRYHEREAESYDDVMRDLEDVSAFNDRTYEDDDRNREGYERDGERSDRGFDDFDRNSDHDRYADEYDRQKGYDRDLRRDGHYGDREDRYSHRDDRFESRENRDDRLFDDRWKDNGSDRRRNERDNRRGRDDWNRREDRLGHGDRREGQSDHSRERGYNRREDYNHDMAGGREESNSRFGDERYHYDERSRDERGGNRRFDERMDDRRRDERSWDRYDDDHEIMSQHERGQPRDFRDETRDSAWDEEYQDQEEEDNLPDPSREEIERLMQRASSNMRFPGGERRGQRGGHSAEGFPSRGNRGGRGVHRGPRGGIRGGNRGGGRGGRGRGNFRGRGPRGGFQGRGGPPRGK